MPNKTVIDLANQVKSYALGIKDQQVFGAWSLLSSEYATSSGTISGVKWTDNEDRTIMSSGTASANSWFILAENTKLGSTGTYLLRGCPTGGSSETYFLRVRDETTSTNYDDYGNGIEINIDSTHNYIVSCGVLSGATAPSVLWKPMILTAMTNRELTDRVNSSSFGSAVSLTANTDYVAPADGVFTLDCYANGGISKGYINSLLVMQDKNTSDTKWCKSIYVKKGMTLKFTDGAGYFIPLTP